MFLIRKAPTAPPAARSVSPPPARRARPGAAAIYKPSAAPQVVPASKAASAHPKIDLRNFVAQGEKRLRRQAVIDTILTAKPTPPKQAPTKSAKPTQLPTLPKYYTHPRFMGIREQREAIAAFKRYLRAADARAVVTGLTKAQAHDVECARARLNELYQHSGLAAF